jgi:F0F1-type ATP synthase membrane subunit b/b'
MTLPQFDPSTFASQVFWLFVCCVVLLLFVRGMFVPRITEIIESREKRIFGDLERAAEINLAVQKLQEDYEKKLTQSKINARHQRESQLAELERQKLAGTSRLNKSFTRRRAVIEKEKYVEFTVEDSFPDILLSKKQKFPRGAKRTNKTLTMDIFDGQER